MPRHVNAHLYKRPFVRAKSGGLISLAAVQGMGKAAWASQTRWIWFFCLSHKWKLSQERTWRPPRAAETCRSPDHASYRRRTRDLLKPSSQAKTFLNICISPQGLPLCFHSPPTLSSITMWPRLCHHCLPGCLLYHSSVMKARVPSCPAPDGVEPPCWGFLTFFGKKQ